MTYRILVVDDDTITRRILETALRNAGYDVKAASDGIEGLTAVEAFAPHLIVSDAEMPRLDGPGMVQEIRARQWTVRVVLLSSMANTAEVARSLGLEYWREKPVDPKEVLALVAAALEGA